MSRAKRKKIDFDDNKRWLNNQPEGFQNRLNTVWKQYIRWKDPNKVINKLERLRMKDIFIMGVIVGVIDIG